MDDLQKAQEAIKNRNYPLAEISKRSSVSLNTLKNYQRHPEKMGNAAWLKITAIARAYDEMKEAKKNADEPY